MSAFYSKGKATALKIAKKKEEYTNLFGDMGREIIPLVKLKKWIMWFRVRLIWFWRVFGRQRCSI